MILYDKKRRGRVTIRPRLFFIALSPTEDNNDIIIIRFISVHLKKGVIQSWLVFQEVMKRKVKSA